MWQVEAGRRYGRCGRVVQMQLPKDRDQQRADGNCQKCRRDSPRELQPRAVQTEQNQHGQQRDGSLVENSKDKTEAKICQRQSGQRTQQSRARSVVAQPVRAKCARGLYDTADQTCKDACLPRERSRMGARINRPHDQKDISEDRGCINAKRNRCHVVASGACSKSPSLPGIEQVADKNGDGDAGKHLLGNKLHWKSAHRSQADDQQQVRKPGEEQAEEPVDISGCEPRLARTGVGAGDSIGLAHTVP